MELIEAARKEAVLRQAAEETIAASKASEEVAQEAARRLQAAARTRAQRLHYLDQRNAAAYEQWLGYFLRSGRW